MPSTHTSLHYHLIFATKNREPNILSSWRDELHSYLGGVVKGLNAHPQAAFTVSASARESVKDYIANQEEHHRTKSFREELIGFLKKSGVAFEEQYLD